MAESSARISSHRALVFALTLTACGGATQNAADSSPEGGRAATPIPAGTGGTGGAGGTSAALPRAKPNIDISGRWGMFWFEDPVGIQVTQAPDGTLSGRACAANAPGPTVEGADTLFCDDLSGSVHGNLVEFHFSPIPDHAYATQVTVSDDGKRMAGTFNRDGGSGMKVGWLRVANDAAWLPAGPQTFDEPLAGAYTLTLVAATGPAEDFAAGTSYWISYSRRALRGDLGAFWNTEISDPKAGGPLRVGPVPATDPGLPVSLQFDFGPAGFTGVKAVTPSGSSYTFSATKQP